MADSYTQGSAQRENVRTTGLYLFAQDSWKINPSLTLNYGLRWELDTPLTDVLHHVQTFRPGQNSTVYPCALTTTEQANFGVSTCADAGVEPTGLVVPGDKGVQNGLTQTYYKAFAPRIGIAYSPNFTHGAMGRLFGANGKTSIRSGWGLFYNPMEQLVLEQFGAEPPFGGSTFLPSTFFNTPFVSQSGTVNPNPFNGILSPTPGQAQDWSSFRPMLLYGDFQPKMRTQYTAQYNLTLQRELARDLVLQNALKDSVSVHQNVTTCQAVVASCFDFSGKRNKVVYSDLNFPSVMYFWEAQRPYGARVHMVKTDDGITVPTDRLIDAIDDETLLVPISHVIFRSAYIQDAKAIIEKAHKVGAHVVLDTFQSLGSGASGCTSPQRGFRLWRRA